LLERCEETELQRHAAHDGRAATISLRLHRTHYASNQSSNLIIATSRVWKTSVRIAFWSIPHNDFIVTRYVITQNPKFNPSYKQHDDTRHTTQASNSQISQFNSTHFYTLPNQQTNTSHIIMSGTSNVGNAGAYANDDQRTVPNSQIEEEKKENRFHEGKEHSHKATDASTSLVHFFISHSTYLAWLPPAHHTHNSQSHQ
jgi:hypothetical protein